MSNYGKLVQAEIRLKIKDNGKISTVVACFPSNNGSYDRPKNCFKKTLFFFRKNFETIQGIDIIQAVGQYNLAEEKKIIEVLQNGYK
jgi:hypothetical protein